MFPILEATMTSKGISRVELAPIMGCTVGTAYLKLRGKSPITLTEAIAVKNFLSVDLPVERLFSSLPPEELFRPIPADKSDKQ